MIEVQDLRKSFGDVEAVRGVSFSVAPGEVFGFLGPNGAGKTTTINMLCTLAKPTSGSATVAGHDVARERDDVRRHIGLVFQDPTRRRVPDRRAEPASCTPSSTACRPTSSPPRMRQVLEMVGLYDRRDAEVKTFSGGMRRRLEIARGLMHSPRVLFLDEPTIGLDPQTRASIWGYIHELREREEITIFMTTHYMDEAEFCDRIAIMDQGEIVALDTPAALKAQVGADRIKIETEDDDAALEALRAYDATRSEGGIAFYVENGAQFVPQLFAELERADHLGQRLAPQPRRRVHVLHRQDDPRRRGRAEREPHDHADDGGPMSTFDIVRVRVPERSYRNELRAIKIVWTRELIRFRKDRLRHRHVARPAAAVPVRARLRRLAEPDDVHLPRHPVHVGDVHRDLQRGVDRVGPRVRLPARDAGRAGAPRRRS